MKRPKNENKLNRVNVHFQNVMSTDYIVQYVLKKIKRPKFSGIDLRDADINIKKIADGGGEKYSVTLSLVAHNVKMFFREVGNNLYAIIDSIVSKINRKLSKMRSNRNFRKQRALKYDY